MKPRPLPVYRSLAALLLLAGLFGVLPRFFPIDPPAEATMNASFAPGEAGMIIAIDPETGGLVAGPAARNVLGDKARDRDLANMLSRSTAGLIPVTHPDGRVSVNLQGRFMNASVARIGTDGSLERACVESSDEAAAFLNADPEAQPETDAYGREVR